MSRFVAFLEEASKLPSGNVFSRGCLVEAKRVHLNYWQLGAIQSCRVDAEGV